MTSKGSIMPSEKRRAAVLSPLLLTTSQTTETGAGWTGIPSWGTEDHCIPRSISRLGTENKPQYRPIPQFSCRTLNLGGPGGPLLVPASLVRCLGETTPLVILKACLPGPGLKTAERPAPRRAEEPLAP